MPSRVLDFPVFDVDNHMYETPDALTKFIAPEYAGTIQYIQANGRTKIAVKGQISDYIPNPTFERVAAPGAQEEYFKVGNPEGKPYKEILGRGIDALPAYRDPAPRLELMDELGIDRAIMWPTLASLVEERLRDDPELIHVLIHALNEWIHETWTFDYESRIFTTPVITLPIVDRAIEELEWVVERGAKAVLIRPAPVPGFRGPRSFALPEFDPFWAKVVEHDVLVTMHASDSGYSRYANEWSGTGQEMLPFQPQAFRMMNSWRPIEDAVTSLVCHGALSRFPDLRIAVIENGSTWLGPLLDRFKDIYKKMPQDFAEPPLEVIRRNIWVSPFWEEDPAVPAALIGEDHILFGSDYPHPEGLADPVSFADEITSLSDEAIAKFMGANLAGIISTEA